MNNFDSSHNLADVQFLRAQAPSVACRWLFPLPPVPSSSQCGALRIRSQSSSTHFLVEDMPENVGSSNYPSLFLRGGMLRERQIFEGAAASVMAPWKRHLFDVASSVDVDALSETIEGVYNTISLLGPGWLDLTALDAGSVQGEHLAAILRATAPWQEYIPGWGEALSVSEAALKRSGVDPLDALFGLI